MAKNPVTPFIDAKPTVNTKPLTAVECEDLLCKIGMHSIALWRVAIKVHRYLEVDKVNQNYIAPFKELLPLINDYIIELDRIEFLKGKTVN